MDSRGDFEIPSVLRPNLQKDTELPNGYYVHPDVPGKVIRWTDDTKDCIQELPYFARLLEDLEVKYQISTVHTQFVISNSNTVKNIGSDDVGVIMISDKIANGVDATTALELAAQDESVLNEFDDLACKELRHLGDTVKNGGVFMPDLYHYQQYIYDVDRPEGEHLVLVDTEPVFLAVEPHPKYKIAGSVPLLLLYSVRSVAEDIIDLEQLSGRISKAQSYLREVVNLFDAEGHEPVERMKLAIVAAVEQNDKSYLDFLDDEDGFYNTELFLDVVESQMLLKTIKEQGIM